MITIRPGRPDEGAALSALAVRAKGHWGYGPELLDRWRASLTVSEEQLRSGHVAVAEREGHALGFYALRLEEAGWKLTDLWVEPEAMGQGVGRALLAHALARAGAAKASVVRLEADPHAEGFYLRMGAQRIGARPAPIPGEPERVLPLMHFDVS